VEDFPDGVWWVELVPLSGPDVVARALAQALGVRPLPGASELDAVVFYLEARRALVLLDNCEHLLAESVVVAQALLAGCPDVKVLATSREPLPFLWRRSTVVLPSLHKMLVIKNLLSLFKDEIRVDGLLMTVAGNAVRASRSSRMLVAKAFAVGEPAGRMCARNGGDLEVPSTRRVRLPRSPDKGLRRPRSRRMSRTARLTAGRACVTPVSVPPSLAVWSC
jgi:hypothetical protein